MSDTPESQPPPRSRASSRCRFSHARRSDAGADPAHTAGLFDPTLISNLLQTLNGTINSIWVGKLIGESALAATANVNIIMFLMMAAVFGFGMATTVRVGQNFGARRIEAARITFGSGLGFAVMLRCWWGRRAGWRAALLHLLATPEASRVEALDCLRVVFVTMPLGTLSIVLAMGLRGVGDSRLPLYAMVLTVGIDIGANPLLIRGWGRCRRWGSPARRCLPRWPIWRAAR
jgi:Na+-driven multidrug efflux pump